jgi:hypothetical protein
MIERFTCARLSLKKSGLNEDKILSFLIPQVKAHEQQPIFWAASISASVSPIHRIESGQIASIRGKILWALSGNIIDEL